MTEIRLIKLTRGYLGERRSEENFTAVAKYAFITLKEAQDWIENEMADVQPPSAHDLLYGKVRQS